MFIVYSSFSSCGKNGWEIEMWDEHLSVLPFLGPVRWLSGLKCCCWVWPPGLDLGKNLRGWREQTPVPQSLTLTHLPQHGSTLNNNKNKIIKASLPNCSPAEVLINLLTVPYCFDPQPLPKAPPVCGHQALAHPSVTANIVNWIESRDLGDNVQGISVQEFLD